MQHDTTVLFTPKGMNNQNPDQKVGELQECRTVRAIKVQGVNRGGGTGGGMTPSRSRAVPTELTIGGWKCEQSSRKSSVRIASI